MAIRGGPDIIEDGLVLHLDAAEPLCFRGEPTTNLMPYTNGVAGRVGWPGGAYTHSIETTGEFAGWEKIVATTTGSIADTVMRVGDVACTANAQYTASMEFYSPYNNLRFNVSGSHGNYIANRIGSSNKYYLNFTIPVNGNQGWWLKTISSTAANTAISNGVIYYRRAQFEQKSYYTDFTIGTRGSTVATGGGLLDLTNNGNNGTITRAASPSAGFYNANNGGSFVFDGANDYIETNYTPGNISTQTISCWINKSNLQYAHILAKSTVYYGFEIYPTTIYVNVGSNKYGAVNYNTNGWQNIVFTYDGNQADNSSRLKIYFNGTGQTATFTGTIPSSINVSDVIQIGRRWWGAYNLFSQGSMGQVSIYNRTLTPTEILQNYNATKGRYGL